MLNKFARSGYGIIAFSLVFMVMSVSVLYLSGFKNDRSIFSVLSVTALSVLGMGLLPLLTVRFVLRRDLRDFGWRLPENNRQAALLSGKVLMVLLPVLVVFSRLDSFRSYYAVGGGPIGRVLLITALLPLLYYLSEEFLFRGFLFFGLWEKFGDDSLWINAFIFSLFHLNKPPLEAAFSFVTAMLLCRLSLKTRSFLPAALVHFLMALGMNALVLV